MVVVVVAMVGPLRWSACGLTAVGRVVAGVVVRVVGVVAGVAVGVVGVVVMVVGAGELEELWWVAA